MEELRAQHLGTPKRPSARSVLAQPRGAFEKVLVAVEAEGGRGVGQGDVLILGDALSTKPRPADLPPVASPAARLR